MINIDINLNDKENISTPSSAFTLPCDLIRDDSHGPCAQKVELSHSIIKY